MARAEAQKQWQDGGVNLGDGVPLQVWGHHDI